MSRILFFIGGDVRLPAGSARQMLSLVEGVRRRGHEIRIVSHAWEASDTHRSVVSVLEGERSIGATMTVPDGVDWVEPDRSTRDYLQRLYSLYQIRVLRPMVRQAYIRVMEPIYRQKIAAHKPDWVILFGTSLIYYNEAFLNACIGASVKCGSVPLCHLTTGDNTGARFRALYRKLDAVLPTTRVEADWLTEKAGVLPIRSHILGAGPDYALLGPSARFAELPIGTRDIPPDSPVVLFLARKVLFKGYLPVLNAMRTVWATFPAAHFVFAGPATDEWRRDKREFEQDPRFHDVDSIDQARVPLLERSAVMCVPSISESFGLIYTEAWLFGKPVIAADTPVSRELIENTRGGVVTSQSAEDVAQAILQMLAHPERAREMGEAGREAVRRQYNWDAIAGKFETALGLAPGGRA